MRERLRRWGFRVTAALLGVAALYYLLLAGEYSALDVRALERERERVAARIDSLRLRADSLDRRADSLEADPLAIERAARETHGLVRDGERVYRFVAPPAAEAVDDPRRAP